jgi:alpha-beta hydrolase superfamily lysophospholipase
MVRTGIAALFAQARCRNAVALTLFALCACAPTLAPRGSGSETPFVQQDVFVTRDGLRLPLRHWDAAKPAAIIVALHGMSDYSEAFDLPGPWWGAHGISVYAYDQRGFGGASDPGLWAGASEMRNDLDDIVAALRAKFRGLPVYVLGESMGGAVVLTALASPNPPRVDGVILVAPAVWSREDMPLSYRVVLWIGAHMLPAMHVSGEGLHIWATDNLGVLRHLAHDPLYQNSARVDQLYGLVKLMDDARHAPQRIGRHPPILFLYGGNDQVIPAEPTEAVAKALDGSTTVIRYPHGYHMLLRDLEAEPRWNDVLLWIEKTNQPARTVARNSARMARRTTSGS